MTLAAPKNVIIRYLLVLLSSRRWKTVLNDGTINPASFQLKIYREATKDLRSYGVVQSLDVVDLNDLKKLISDVFFNREEEVFKEIKESNKGLVSTTKSLFKKVINRSK